jgi:adenylylsulfate kinase-like enzyme
MIVVLFGQPHCGKSTLANILTAKLPADNIDGDDLRELFKNKDYSREGRIKNLNRASDIAHFINHKNQGYSHVVLSLVYPYKEARDYLNSLLEDIVWVYLTYSGERGRENFHVKDFEIPTEEAILSLDTSKLTVEECINKITDYANEKLLSKSGWTVIV